MRVRCHDDCNLYSDDSEKNTYIYREREKANMAKMLTISEFGGGGIIVLFFQLVRRFEIFQTKKLVEEKINTLAI